MNDGIFIRILYSPHIFTLNGIYISININYTSIEKYFNKFKCVFDVILHKVLIHKLGEIEANIISKLNIKGLTPQYKIYEQIKNGSIKFFSEKIDPSNNTFFLKISGAWETESYYGLTYKFIKA